MKTHEITTSKGEFVVKDMPIEFNPQEGYTFEIKTQNKEVIYSHTLICKLSEATEEDAKGVVGNIHLDNNDYLSSKAYLQLLIQSRGIDVNNGNWYLFKKL